MQKHVEQIDRETGEVMQGCMVYIPYRPRLTERWFMAFQDSFEEIAKDPEMTGETYKVLMYLYSKLDFENFIQQSQMDIAPRTRYTKAKSLKSNEGTNFKTNRT